MAVREHGLFRKLDRPPTDVALGGCLVNGDSGPGVDTGVLIDYVGTVYLGLGVIKELAEVAGFSVNEEGYNLEIANAELERQVSVLNAENLELRELLDADAKLMGQSLRKGQAKK